MSRSIYQTNGKPLSQQAIYQQKLKLGVFNSPGAPSVGVNSNASDTAALLAASTDLTVKPSYERTVAPEAHDAALAAKWEKIYQWSRQVDQDAASAATAGLEQSRRLNTISSSTTYQSTSSELGVPGLKAGSIFQAASKNLSATMTSRINPDKNHRHGLAPSSANAALNIDKILLVATANSSKTMTSRTDPSASSRRSGLATTNRGTSFQAGDISGQYLLSAASQKAQTRLDSLLSGTPQDFKAQAQAYANALAIAQKRSDERVATSKKGLIDLGGGLTVSQAELDAMASLIVQPVLSDIDSKASLQRQNDAAAKKAKAEAVKQHEAAKQAEIEAKQKEKAELEREKQLRVDANTAAKSDKDKEYVEYQAGEDEKVTAKLAEVKEQEEKYAAEKAELLTQKQQNQDSIDEEELKLIADRKKVLDDTQAEKDEEIAPLLEELKVESSKLQELTDAKTQLDTEVSQLETLNLEYTAKIKELEAQLQSTEDDIVLNTKNLEESETKLADSSKELEQLHTETEAQLGDIDTQHKQLDLELAAFADTKKQHLADKELQKKQIKEQLSQRVKEEHEINLELPDHLKKDVNESKLLDTASLFSNETPVVPKASKEPETKVPEPVKSSPKKASKIKRLSNLFKSSKKEKLQPQASKPEKKDDTKSQQTSHSYESYEDDISVNVNKGGVFKEEI